jgi:hypothetical protein
MEGCEEQRWKALLLVDDRQTTGIKNFSDRTLKENIGSPLTTPSVVEEHLKSENMKIQHH